MLYLCCTFGVSKHLTMATSVKVVLRKKKNKDGTYPLAIRITKDRNSSFVYLGHNLKTDDWDKVNQRVKKSHPNMVRLNNKIAAKVAEVNDTLLDLEKTKTDTSARAVKKGYTSAKQASFFAQAKIYLDNIKERGKYNCFVSEEPRINRFKEFLGGHDITFQEITVGLLKKFTAYLEGKHSCSERTIMNYLILIRTIYNQAIEANIADRRYYPFGRGKIVIKLPQSLKIGLTADEVKTIEDLVLPADSLMEHARRVWLFSFYFAGVRASDVLRMKWEDFQNDRLFYTMGKNNKPDSLKVPEKALRIIEPYRKLNNKRGLIFPELTVLDSLDDSFEVERKISYAIKQLDKYLKDVAEAAKITKKLTMHIARHTFGNISGDKISIQMLKKLYRHSSITTTVQYQANFIHKDADEALDAVIGK